MGGTLFPLQVLREGLAGCDSTAFTLTLQNFLKSKDLPEKGANYFNEMDSYILREACCKECLLSLVTISLFSMSVGLFLFCI